MPRTATIGPEIYARVNELLAEGKSRTEAFAQVGKERKSRAGTVAANYYRVARASGQTSRRRSRKASPGRAAASRKPAARSPRTQTRRTTTTSSDADLRKIVEQIAELTAQLVRQVEDRDARIRALLG